MENPLKNIEAPIRVVFGKLVSGKNIQAAEYMNAYSSLYRCGVLLSELKTGHMLPYICSEDLNAKKCEFRRWEFNTLVDRLLTWVIEDIQTYIARPLMKTAESQGEDVFRSELGIYWNKFSAFVEMNIDSTGLFRPVFDFDALGAPLEKMQVVQLLKTSFYSIFKIEILSAFGVDVELSDTIFAPASEQQLDWCYVNAFRTFKSFYVLTANDCRHLQ